MRSGAWGYRTQLKFACRYMAIWIDNEAHPTMIYSLAVLDCSTRIPGWNMIKPSTELKTFTTLTWLRCTGHRRGNWGWAPLGIGAVQNGWDPQPSDSGQSPCGPGDLRAASKGQIEISSGRFARPLGNHLSFWGNSSLEWWTFLCHVWLEGAFKLNSVDSLTPSLCLYKYPTWDQLYSIDLYDLSAHHGIGVCLKMIGCPPNFMVLTCLSLTHFKSSFSPYFP